MQTLPQPASYESEARPVSEILAKADPADLPAMRAGLSFLTSAGAELSAALARRNEEYDKLLAVVSVLPPEWIEAAKTGGSLPDFGSLRAELELAKDERIDLLGQLAERQQQIQALQEQIAQLEAGLAVTAEAEPAVEPEPEAEAQPSVEIEAMAAQLEELRAELDSIALDRSQAEDALRSSQAELADMEQQLASLSADLWAALPEETQAQLAAAPADDQAQDARQRRAMRLGALAAAATALVERSQQSDALAEEAAARAAAIQGDLVAAGSARMALEADLGEKEQSLADLAGQVESLQAQSEQLNAQIEQIKEQTAELQVALDAALAARAAAEEQLVAREGELAELHQQIDSVGQELRAVLPEDLLAQVVPADEEMPAEEMGEEGEIATRSAAPKLLGLGTIAAGVAAAVDLSKQKSGEAAEASGLLASVADEKASLESALADKEQTVAELNSQIEALTGQSAELQGQIEAALAVKADLEQQLGQRDLQLADLQGQVDDTASRLQAILPGEDLLDLSAGLDAEQEGEEGGARTLGLAALVGGVAGLVERKESSTAELNSQIEALHLDLDGLGQEKAALEAALAEKAQELAGYNDYFLTLQGQVNQLAAEKSAVEADLQIRTQAQAEAEAQFDSLTAQVNDLQAQVDALTIQVGELQAQLEAGAAAKAEVDQALSEAQAQLQAAQADLAQIEQESERALGTRAAGLGAVGAGVAAVAVLKEKEAELAAANEQLLALQGQINEMAAGGGEAAELQVQVDELARAKAEIEAQLGERNVELEALTAQLAELEAERDGIALGKEELLADLQSREVELTELRSQLEALQGQVESVAQERAVLQEQIEEMEEDLSEVDTLRSAALNFEAASTLSETLAKLPPIKTSAASAAIVAGVQPTLSPRIQALTDVKGIGSVYQQRLYSAGVGTYWELSSLPDGDMQDILQIPDLQRTRIDLAETRADAYRLAQATGTVGLLWDGDHVDDFEPLPGIGKTFEKRLYEAGITTFQQLVDCDTQRLVEIIDAPPMRELNYDELKERARQLLAEHLTSQPPVQDQPTEEG